MQDEALPQMDTDDTPLEFKRARAVLSNDRWSARVAENPAVGRALAELLQEAFNVPLPQVLGYPVPQMPGTVDEATGVWAEPAPIGVGRFMHTIVMKEWQPPGEVNDFQQFESKLGLGGQACVDFAVDFLRVDLDEVRDYLAGMSQGLALK
ncbi:hypothetical protein [Variovorax saccharolyticus]|uniref:hypothetical protein n=1 Tax=Variovorax saccharolyticus TaxID=3053516 RepID=UPI00257599AB|nr:hypothetical protein [Variovorax sp. J31P216]MDM0029860.1 hypothetical protein [Variovorax sp. J31P216]